MRQRTPSRRDRRGEHGQAMVENLLAVLTLCLVLVGLLQVFHLSVAQLLTRYSAFCTARSHGVGFADYLLQRSARVGAIGASGKITFPDNQTYGSPVAQYYGERMMIPEYIQGTRWLEYEYWLGENAYDARYYAPGTTPPQTSIGHSYQSAATGLVDMQVRFRNYPFVFFDLMDRNRVWFDTAGDATEITGRAEVANHAADYLQD